MSRPLRIEYPGAFYHVTTHSNGSLTLFKNDEDCRYFLNFVGSGVRRYKIIIHAFTLMRNHLHLLVETPIGNLSSFMRNTLSEYGRFYNCKYDRKGSVFTPRYGALLVQKDKYYNTLIRYIYLNPVKAGLVEKPQKYRWSSLYYLLNEDLMEEIPWFKPEHVYSILKNIDEILELLHERKLSELKKVHRFFIGEHKWAEKIIHRNRIKLNDNNISGIKSIKKNLNIENKLKEIWNSFDMNKGEIIKNKRSPSYKAVIYILKELFPLTNKRIAEIMENTDTAVAKIYSRMKKEPEKYDDSFKIVNKIKKMSNVKT